MCQASLARACVQEAPGLKPRRRAGFGLRRRLVLALPLSVHMDEETLAKLMQRAVTSALTEQGVATKSDNEKVQGHLQKHDAKFSELERRIAALEQAPPQNVPRQSTGGISTASGSTSASQDAAWTPRLIQLCGWAPWACGAEDKLRKADARELGKRNLAPTPPHLAAALFPLQPHALNRAIAFKVVDGSDVRAQGDELQGLLEQKDFMVSGKVVCAAPESSPARRRVYAASFEHLRRFEAAGPPPGSC